jgi:hypothetical protein
MSNNEIEIEKAIKDMMIYGSGAVFVSERREVRHVPVNEIPLVDGLTVTELADKLF